MGSHNEFATVHVAAETEVGEGHVLDITTLRRDPRHLAEAERELARRSRSGTVAHAVLFTFTQLVLGAGGWLGWRIAISVAVVALTGIRLWVVVLIKREQGTPRQRRILFAIGALGMPAAWGLIETGQLAVHGISIESMIVAAMVCGIAMGVIHAMAPAERIQQLALLGLLLPISTIELIQARVDAWPVMNLVFYVYASAQGRVAARDYWRALGTTDLLARHSASLRTAITERKQLEENLRFAERMASLGTLAAGVAHEINNPMTYVLGNLDLLEEWLATHPPLQEGAKGEVAQLISEAQDGARRVVRIVRDLKTFSRRADDEPLIPISLEEALDTASEIAMTQIRHRACLERDYQGSTMVLANRVKLGQVFLNLIVNAAQAIPEDSDPTLHRVRLLTYVGADGTAIAEVRDTGAGIAPAVRPHIFDPFFTTKPVGVGTGLGLSSALGIVSALGATIEVDSTVGVGTTMRVRFPAATAT